MRSVFSLFDFGLLLLTIVALLHTQGTNAQPEEMCRPGNCMARENCEMLASGLRCQNRGDTCCSLVKREHRTLCEHWGGTCMDECSPRLQEKSEDCPAPTKCCVLVS